MTTRDVIFPLRRDLGMFKDDFIARQYSNAH